MSRAHFPQHVATSSRGKLWHAQSELDKFLRTSPTIANYELSFDERYHFAAETKARRAADIEKATRDCEPLRKEKFLTPIGYCATFGTAGIAAVSDHWSFGGLVTASIVGYFIGTFKAASVVSDATAPIHTRQYPDIEARNLQHAEIVKAAYAAKWEAKHTELKRAVIYWQHQVDVERAKILSVTA